MQGLGSSRQVEATSHTTFESNTTNSSHASDKRVEKGKQTYKVDHDNDDDDDDDGDGNDDDDDDDGGDGNDDDDDDVYAFNLLVSGGNFDEEDGACISYDVFDGLDDINVAN
ncbi:hypothetical protein L3X38_011520 [Prunus dulcis]|uniref:Uncharacterized protein n=1 Tax=Prunus dulcis TaxID=3755 RepID=A0AAD4ZF75_PRUDU|nr:hypothetical protein L3X38_011520 [Prunus dulcis]